MAYGRTTYSGSEGQTEASGYGDGGQGGGRGGRGGDMGGGMGWLFQLAGRRANQKLQEQQEALSIQREQSKLDAEMKREQLKQLKEQSQGSGWGGGGGRTLAETNVMQAQQNAAIAKARAEETQARTLSNPMRNVQEWQHFLENNATPAQRATSLIGGYQGQAFGGMARQMAAMTAAGVPLAEYTGFTELAKAGSAASAKAEEAAGNQRYAARADAAKK